MQNDTQTAERKGPPAWMHRAPMSRDAVAAALNSMALALRDSAREIRDADVTAGLTYQARILELTMGALDAGNRLNPETVQALGHVHAARLGCAKATTDDRQRRNYMNEAHTLREAMRYLGEAK